MAEYLLVGWEQIWRDMFHDKDGKAVISFSTLSHKYAPEMRRLGVVYRFKVTKGKLVNICGYPSQIKRYLTLKQQKGEL